MGRTAMKAQRRKRRVAPGNPVSIATTTIFSSDLLQEAVCGLMQAIDRFDVSHGTRLATYATWWIRQTLQIAVARQSHLVSLSPHHLQELGLLQQESEALAHGGKHLPSPQELASRTGSSLEHLTHLQTATRTPVSLNAF